MILCFEWWVLYRSILKNYYPCHSQTATSSPKGQFCPQHPLVPPNRSLAGVCFSPANCLIIICRGRFRRVFPRRYRGENGVVIVSKNTGAKGPRGAEGVCVGHNETCQHPLRSRPPSSSYLRCEQEGVVRRSCRLFLRH